MVNIEKIIDEILKELEIGVVKNKQNLFMKVHSNTSSGFEVTPTLNLNNKEEFYSIVKKYIALFEEDLYWDTADYTEEVQKNISYRFIKNKIAYLFANMSFDDFNNPIDFVRRYINFNKNKLLERKTIDYIDGLSGKVHINIRKSDLETPYCFESAIVSDEGYYSLPTINYGISDNICYVYAIKNAVKRENKTKYQKKIDRLLYKLNTGVMDRESQEYKDYKSGLTEYYPENVSDVSPNSVLALTLFLNEVQKQDINRIEVIPYLPVRFENHIKNEAYDALQEAKKKNLNEQQKRELYIKNVKDQLKIQSNITEKFIRTFYRVAHHFDNVNITSLPMELDSNLHILLSKFEYSDNDILNEIVNSNNKTL